MIEIVKLLSRDLDIRETCIDGNRRGLVWYPVKVERSLNFYHGAGLTSNTLSITHFQCKTCGSGGHSHCCCILQMVGS